VYRLLLAGALALLAACAGPTGRQPDVAPGTWANHAAALAALQEWTASGKLGLRTSEYAESASMQWRQRGQHTTIQLSGPVGINSTIIESDGRRLALTRGDEQRSWDVTSMDALARETGWELPVTALPHWLKGMPAPGLEVQLLELDADRALLQSLRQDDWEVRYEDYASFSRYTLPTRLRIQRGATSARVIIREWQIPGP
jgi:outer membrane lipoprotein LolB